MLNAALKREIVFRAKGHRLFLTPHPLLQKYISHYVFYFSDEDTVHPVERKQTHLSIVPDASGCIVFKCTQDEIHSILWGPTSQMRQVKNDVDKGMIYFFIEFLPGGLRALTGIHQTEVSDAIFSFHDVLDRTASLLKMYLTLSTHIHPFISHVDHLMLGLLESHNKQNPIVMSCLEKVKQQHGRLSVRELATGEYVSERQLHRLFHEYIGVNVKTFTHIVRLNHTIKLIKSPHKLSLAHIAFESGYYDESHMIKSFASFMGVTPGVYLGNMSDFYNESLKY